LLDSKRYAVVDDPNGRTGVSIDFDVDSSNFRTIRFNLEMIGASASFRSKVSENVSNGKPATRVTDVKRKAVYS